MVNTENWSLSCKFQNKKYAKMCMRFAKNVQKYATMCKDMQQWVNICKMCKDFLPVRHLNYPVHSLHTRMCANTNLQVLVHLLIIIYDKWKYSSGHSQYQCLTHFLIARLHCLAWSYMCLFISVWADNDFNCIYLIRNYLLTFCSESLGQSLALTAKLWILKRRHMERSSKYCSRIYIIDWFLS